MELELLLLFLAVYVLWEQQLCFLGFLLFQIYDMKEIGLFVPFSPFLYRLLCF